MTLRFHSRLTADGKQAKTEVKATAAEAKKLAQELVGIEREGKDAQKSLAAVGSSSRSAADGLTLNAAQTKKLRDTHTQAAGSIANLTAQFNDIGVMLMAGQNPLQLAIQQGTQIGQVFQQTGVKGRGALSLLLSGVSAMVSPINLITIGSIAAGAAMTQWLTSSSRKAKPLAEQIDDLGSKLDDYRKAADLASESTEALEDRFGQITPRIRSYLQKAAASEMRALKLAQREIAQTMVKESGLALPNDGLGDLAQVGEMMGYSGFFSTNGLMGEGRDERRAIFSEIIGGFRDIEDAADKSTDAQIAAAERLRDGLEAGSRLVGGITSEELTRLRSVEEYLMRLYEIRAREPDEGRLAGQAESAWTQYYRSRVLGERELQAEQQRTIQKNTYAPYQASRAESAQSLASGQDMLAMMQQQNELARIAVLHGEDSVEMTQARSAAERRAFEETVNTLDVSEALKLELLQAFDNGQMLANLDIESGIWGAAQAASQLAANLSEAAAQKAAMGAIGGAQAKKARAQIMLDTVGQPVKRAGALAADDFQRSLPDGGYGLIANGQIDRLKSMETSVRSAAEDAAALEEQARAADAEYRKLQQTLSKPGGRKKSKGGSSAAKKLKSQREAVAKLTQSYDRELSILMESDPVQREMIRNRETLAHATDQERAAIKAKIAELQTEQEAQDQASAANDYLTSTATDLIPALVRGGDDAASSWERFARSLEDAAWQALLLGEGPLMSLLSGVGLGGGGSALGFIGKLLGFADGGMNYGKGGGRDDANLALLSSGEFTVNAQATARHRALLEAINSGAPLPGFADGGFNGVSQLGPTGGLKIQLIDQSRGVDVRAQEVPDQDGGRRLEVLIDERVGASISKKGSAARRAMETGFGLAPARPRR